MAVTLRSALGPVPGSSALLGLRLLARTLVAVPALVAAALVISRGPALSPYFTGAELPLPVDELLRLLLAIGAVPLALVLAAPLLAWPLQLFVTAGAIDRFFRPRDRRRSVVRVCVDSLVLHLGPLLRVSLLGLTLLVLGVAVIALLHGEVSTSLARGGASQWVLRVILPGIFFVVALWWSALVGAWSLAAKVLTVIDARRRVLKTAVLALRLLLAFPLRGLAFFVVASGAAALVEGLVLACWRSVDPRGPVLLALMLAWVASALFATFVWHWTVRAAVLVYGESPLRGSADLKG